MVGKFVSALIGGFKETAEWYLFYQTPRACSALALIMSLLIISFTFL